MSGICRGTTTLGMFITYSLFVSNLMCHKSLGIPQARSKVVRRHFTDNFSNFNRKISVKNHTLLLLDAPGLVEEDYQRTAQGQEFDEWSPPAGGAVEFVKANVAGEIQAHHHNPDAADCSYYRPECGARHSIYTHTTFAT
jgi:hypothetical protein